ncbi:Fic/DOC family protein [Pseudonocardia endophytica]|uniref:protein adenylyltransferase n=1 Tax=Pseudonocardia endophytica TaxID=401976 RepID=A0A4R1HSQ2_PSEEN|nr:Fic family protein [Pseudonocardia endophytica]TCK22889.1 cell filamentation protein [Pseudonocardia endophytica]
MTWDPDLDLEHGVLRNRLKMTDPAALAAAEAAATTVRIRDVAKKPIPGGYDLPHLQHMHWFIAGDVYPFAGKIRTVRMGKGGNMFCAPEEIETRASTLFDDRTDPVHLRELGRSDVLSAATGLMTDLVWLHPFREVNGRTIRAFTAQLVRTAGWSLDWDGLDRERNRAAARAAFDGDLAPLRALLDERLHRA